MIVMRNFIRETLTEMSKPANRLNKYVYHTETGQGKLSETRHVGMDEYKSCYISDLTRMDMIENALQKIQKNTNYNTENPKLDKLLNTFNGYDDLSYIQNNMKGKEIIFWEGWVQSCWEGAYEKPEYKGMKKEDVIRKLVKDRFPRIAMEFNMRVKSFDYFWHESEDDLVDDGYIMKVVMEPEAPLSEAKIVNERHKELD